VIVLGIETSTPQTSVALGSERGILAEVVISSGRSNHELVAPAIENVLAWGKVELSSVAGIAVGVGPGLFTSLRVGVETAKTLSQVLKVPILGIASLDILAFSVRHSRRPIVAAVDARRGEVFYCIYRPMPGGVGRLGGFAVAKPERVVAEIQALAEEVLLVGDGAVAYREVFDQLGAAHDTVAASASRPMASSLVELAAPRFEREEHDDLYEVVPTYLRKSDAEIAWDKRSRVG
jgi:tRNA threonylcarbamoyladenosine biosynthesis protein TsaB